MMSNGYRWGVAEVGVMGGIGALRQGLTAGASVDVVDCQQWRRRGEKGFARVVH